jgi:hypothetical protein
MCPYLQINRYAFSGGQDSIEKHRQLGANLEVLSFFFIPSANIYEGDSVVRSCNPYALFVGSKRFLPNSLHD